MSDGKRFHGRTLGALAVAGFIGFISLACSNVPDPTGVGILTDAGNLNSAPGAGHIANEAGLELQTFLVPTDPGPNAVYVTISGESTAVRGYPFPPGDFKNDTYMFDGWQFVIREYIIVVDKLTLWPNPNKSATDQSQHDPNPIAHLNGPFVVDLHKGGPIIGQGGSPEQATALGVIANQNDNGGAALDPTVAYAFGFSTASATYSGYNVNLTSDEAADFDYMVKNGYSVLYVGSATWMGSQSTYGCTQTSVGTSGASGGVAGDAGGGYDFSKLPPTMTFRLGFSTPTNYVNCQNFTAQGKGIGGEDSPRGIQVSASQSSIAQVTVHMDHPFWESFAEDTPVHWDQIAAQYVGVAGVPEAHTEDMRGVPFYAFTDKTGAPIPWRNCSGPNYTPPGNGQMFFNPLSVPVDPKATDPQKAIRDYYDFMRYTQSTQGHLNSQGLCYVDRQYAAPPGGS